MAIEHHGFFNGGGWTKDFQDYSAHEEDSNQKSFKEKQVTVRTTKSISYQGFKRIKQVKTMLSLSDLTLLNDLREVESKDATVPVYKMPEQQDSDLAMQWTPSLDVLASFETLGPAGPLGILGGNFPTAETVSSVLIQNDDPCMGSSNLTDLDVNESFQDLSDLIDKKYSAQSPTETNSISSEYSPVSLNSESSSAHFFPTTSTTEFSYKPTTGTTNNSEMNFVFTTPSTSSMCQNEEFHPSDNRYVEMRRKNNIASKRSRQTRREREIENEGRVRELEQSNEDLRAKVRKLEEMTEAVKGILIRSVISKR